MSDRKINLHSSTHWLTPTSVFSEKYRLENYSEVTAPTRLLPDGNLKKDYFSDALLICSE